MGEIPPGKGRRQGPCYVLITEARCSEPWSKFEGRVEEEKRKALASCKKKMTEGCKPTPQKRSRDGRRRLVAFDYAVLYQVCGWSRERVAAEFDGANETDFKLRADAVMEQIHWVADAIELTLRPAAKPGRPRRLWRQMSQHSHSLTGWSCRSGNRP